MTQNHTSEVGHVGDNEEYAHGIIGITGIRRELRVVQHGIPNPAVQKCEDNIEELREQLDSKEKTG